MTDTGLGRDIHHFFTRIMRTLIPLADNCPWHARFRMCEPNRTVSCGMGARVLLI